MPHENRNPVLHCQLENAGVVIKLQNEVNRLKEQLENLESKLDSIGLPVYSDNSDYYYGWINNEIREVKEKFDTEIREIWRRL